jgi:drug/metabolite transporter (DMT)-like permease
MEREYWYVFLTGVLSGTLVFGAKALSEIGLSMYQIAILVPLFSFMLLPLVLLKKKYRIRRAMLKWFAISGFVGFLINFPDYGAVILGVPVATAVLLIYTQPLWTVIFGRVFLKESITKMKIISLILVILGTIVLIGPFAITSLAITPGTMLALAGGLILSAWVIVVRSFGKKGYNPVTMQFGYAMFCLAFLLISYPLITIFFSIPSITSFSLDIAPIMWIYLLFFALLSSIIPHILHFKGSRKVPASTAGIILLTEPVSAALLAAAFLLQPITLNILLGGALILLSNYLVVRKSS